MTNIIITMILLMIQITRLIPMTYHANVTLLHDTAECPPNCKRCVLHDGTPYCIDESCKDGFLLTTSFQCTTRTYLCVCVCARVCGRGVCVCVCRCVCVGACVGLCGRLAKLVVTPMHTYIQYSIHICRPVARGGRGGGVGRPPPSCPSQRFCSTL